MAHATLDDLREWLGVGPPEDAKRLLDRASQLIDSKVLRGYETTEDGLPKETRHAEALRDATCAQVEWWIETGDETGLLTAVTSLQSGSVQIQGMRSQLAPRAAQALLGGNLLYRGVG